MKNFTSKQKWKFWLLLVAILIGVASMVYINWLVKNISRQEEKNARLWAEAVIEVQSAALDQDLSNVIYKIMQDNKSTPLILSDQQGTILAYQNLDEKEVMREGFLDAQLKLMGEQHEPLVIDLGGGEQHFIYYRDSNLLAALKYYPYIQITVLSIFIIVAYMAFNSSRKAEQNQVWVGMSKETAHQLGTPISSLLAWVELLKMQDNAEELMVDEVEKDVIRLKTIAERFSKIGSETPLEPANITDILMNAVGYLKLRTPSRVEYILNFSQINSIIVPLNIPLFEWVIENLCKNAIDSMAEASGSIVLTMFEQDDYLIIDVTDTGKGIPKSKFKSVFQPGYTTKKRGWGLGLSLVKRIIELNHNGKVYVRHSEMNKGTTFRIMLRKYPDGNTTKG